MLKVLLLMWLVLWKLKFLFDDMLCFMLDLWFMFMLLWCIFFMLFMLLCFIMLWFILVIVWLLYFFISVCMFIWLSIGFIDSWSWCCVSFVRDGNVGRVVRVFSSLLEVGMISGWMCSIGCGLLKGVIVMFIWFIGRVIRLKGLLLLVFISILKCFFIKIGNLLILIGLVNRLLLLVIMYSGCLLLVVKLREWVL